MNEAERQFWDAAAIAAFGAMRVKYEDSDVDLTKAAASAADLLLAQRRQRIEASGLHESKATR
jgi:hypothetical protein